MHNPLTDYRFVDEDGEYITTCPRCGRYITREVIAQGTDSWLIQEMTCLRCGFYMPREIGTGTEDGKRQISAEDLPPVNLDDLSEA